MTECVLTVSLYADIPLIREFFHCIDLDLDNLHMQM